MSWRWLAPGVCCTRETAGSTRSVRSRDGGVGAWRGAWWNTCLPMHAGMAREPRRCNRHESRSSSISRLALNQPDATKSRRPGDLNGPDFSSPLTAAHRSRAVSSSIRGSTPIGVHLLAGGRASPRVLEAKSISGQDHGLHVSGSGRCRTTQWRFGSGPRPLRCPSGGPQRIAADRVRPPGR